MLEVINNGRLLATCKHLIGFDSVLARINQRQSSALSELVVVAALVKLGYTPVLSPTLEGRELDALVTVDNQDVYIEVIAPDDAEATLQAQEAAESLATDLKEKIVGLRLEILLSKEPTPDVRDTILDFIGATPPSDTIHELPTVGLLKVERLTTGTPNLGPTIPRPYESAAIGISTARITTDNIATSAVVAIRLPIVDVRAKRLINAESHHFSRDKTNLLIIDVTSVPGDGIHWWTIPIQNCFHPTQRRRFGAVILFDHYISIETMAIEQQWSVIRNPYALRKPPNKLLQDITTLTSSY